MRQLELARLFSFSAHSAEKAPIGCELVNVVVCRGDPYLIVAVNRDRERTWHQLVAAEMAGRDFVVSPGEQKCAIRAELLHATDGCLRGVEIAVMIEGKKVRAAAAASPGRVAAEFARRDAVLAPGADRLALR